MKTELTREESKHLLDLGVPKEKASHVSIKQIYDFRGNSIKNPKEFIRKSPFKPAVMGFEAFDVQPIFKLEDFLNGEILPREMETKNGDVCLEIQLMNEICCATYEYTGHGGCKGYGEGEELIDALYELTCWYYGEFLKSEEK